MLSSFINRRKVKKISLFDAALRRAPSSPLELHSDHENSRSKQWASLSKAQAAAATGPRASAFRRQSSPKVHLDFTPSSSNDWFPQGILAPYDDDDDGHLPLQPVPQSGASSAYDDVVVIGPEQPSLKPKPSPALPPLPVDSGPSPIEPGHDTTTPLLSRKPAPAPIKIPNHPSKVQIQHSASTNHSGPKETGSLFPATTHERSNTLQPGTAHQSSTTSPNDGSSAISGTTLARALIANSFTLSNDNPGRTRYKSGGNLVRQDSATLPDTNENGLLISPYWRDRRVGGGEIVHSPDSGVDSSIPPVPPLPQSLSSAQSRSRHLSTEVLQKPLSRSQSLRIVRLSSRLSKKPEPPSLVTTTASPSHDPIPAPISSDSPRPPLPQPPSNRPTPHDNPSNHSLSNPSSPPRDPSPNPNATSSDPAVVNVRRSQLPHFLDLSSPSTAADTEDSSKLRPTPGDNQDEPQRTGASSNTTRTEKTIGSATSGEDITKVLTTYRFVSPLKSSFPIHLHRSPDSSTPSLSPWSGGPRSHKTDTSSPMSFPQTPDSATNLSRNGLSVLDMGLVFADPNALDQRQSGPSRPGLLPIGNDRPRSLHIPSSPFSRKSTESRRSTDGTSPAASNPRSSGISSPDILDFMFIPSAPSLPSRPHPIKVIRESLDSFEGISTKSPTTAEAFRQTFPETPQAFSPLFSANASTPGVPPLPSSSVGTPGTPLSAAHARGKTRKGFSNPAIKRAISLYSRKTSSNSNRTRMTPIPSAPGTPESPEIRKVNDVRKSSKFEAQQLQAAANLSTLSAPGEVSSPVPASPRRNSDPTGRISRDLGALADRAEIVEEISRSTPEVEEPETEPPNTPSQPSTLAPPEKSPSPSFRSRSAAEGEGRLPTLDPQDKDRDNASPGSVSVPSVRGPAQPDNQVWRSGPKQRPQPLDLPVVNSDDEPAVNGGPVTRKSDGSSGVREEQESAGPSSRTDITPKTWAIPAVSADVTTPVSTSPRVSPAASVRSPNTSELSSPRVNVLPDISSSHPSPNPSSHTIPNVSATSSPVPPVQSPLSRNPTPTSPASQVQNTSSALPSSTLISPAQYDLSNSLDIPSFASFLRQSYTGLVAIHPPPPYQTAILSRAVSVNEENEPPAESVSSLPSYIHTLPNQQSCGQQPAQPARLPQAQAQCNPANIASVSEGVVRERSDSIPDTRMPRSRPLGPRKPSGSQGPNKFSSLRADRTRQGSVSSVCPHVLRPGVGLGTPPNSRKLSTASSRGRPGPRFPTVPVKWRGYTLDVARWTFTSQQLQEIALRAIKTSAESYYVRLLKLETLDTELPEELHRLELLTMDLKMRLRAAATARRELLDTLTAHASGTGTLDRHNLERVAEELSDVTQLAEEWNDELYTVADQIAQLKRLRDVHSSSALAMSSRKLNASFLRQAAENQFLRERVAALEAERDIAWTQAEHVAQEFDDLSFKLEQGIASTPSSANNSHRASRVSAVRKSSIRVSKSGLRLSVVGKPSLRTPKRSSTVSSFVQPPGDIPPVPPVPDVQDPGSDINQPSRHRPPVIQTVNLPEQFTPAGLYSMTPTTETRAMAQAQRELYEILGVNVADLNTLKSRPQSMSGLPHHNRPSLPGLARRNSDVKPQTPKRYSQQYRDYILSPYDRELTLANLTLLD